jgi:hypothetical protein
LRELQADLGLRPHLRPPQRLKIGASAKGAYPQIGSVLADRRGRRELRDLEGPGSRYPADHTFEVPALSNDLQLRAANGLLRLEGRSAAAEQFDFREVAALDASLVERDDFVERRRVPAREAQVLLRELEIDERLLHLESERADRVQHVSFRAATLFAGDVRTARPLPAKLKQEVDACAVLGRARAVLLVESGAEEIQMVTAQTEHGVRPEPCREQVGVGNGEPRPLRDEVEVLVERFREGSGQRQALRGTGGTRRLHLSEAWWRRGESENEEHEQRYAHE